MCGLLPFYITFYTIMVLNAAGFLIQRDHSRHFPMCDVRIIAYQNFSMWLTYTFAPIMCVFSSVWCGHIVPSIGKYHLSTCWCACKYQPCFATCTDVHCRLSTVLVQHYVFCYFVLIIKGSGGIISVTCSAIAVQLEVYCSDWPTGQKITTANPSPHVTRPLSTCKTVVIF